MIKAREKEFWFRLLCKEVFDRHTAMTACSDSVADLDTSRVFAFERAIAKLVGFCIPYQYNVETDYKKGIIKILSHEGRVLRTYTSDVELIDMIPE